MYNKYAVFVLLLTFCLLSCITPAKHPRSKQPLPIDFSTEDSSEITECRPENGTPVFFAATGRESDRDNELNSAMIRAAEQAARFIAVYAYSEFYTHKINSTVLTAGNFDVSWDNDLAESLIDRLDICSYWQDTYGTYIRVKLPGHQMSDIPYNKKSKAGRPLWVDSIPSIPGFIASVGISEQKAYIAESFTAADYDALEKITKQISVDVYCRTKNLNNSAGSVSIRDNVEISELEINGFYVIDRWRSPDRRQYYSLAVARYAE